MKARVKILDSIAGLADADTAKLDAKYALIERDLRGRDKPPTEKAIKERIAELKIADRYAEAPLGFKKDWSFKPGEEVLIEADLAKKWAAAEICQLLDEKKAA